MAETVATRAREDAESATGTPSSRVSAIWRSERRLISAKTIPNGGTGAAVLQEISQDDLNPPGDRNSGQSSDDASEFRPDQHRDQNGERRELHRLAVDERLQQLILDLLVDDEVDEHDHARPDAGSERDSGDDDRGHRGASKRDEIE